MGKEKLYLKNRVIWNRVYRAVFWIGYLAVFSVTFIKLGGDLHKKTIKIITYKFHFDQVLHSFVYILIMLYYLFGQYSGFNLFKNKSFIKYLTLILFLATITEFIQLFVPYRSFNVFDMVANFVGILAGVMVIRMVKGIGNEGLGSRNRGLGTRD